MGKTGIPRSARSMKFAIDVAPAPVAVESADEDIVQPTKVGMAAVLSTEDANGTPAQI